MALRQLSRILVLAIFFLGSAVSKRVRTCSAMSDCKSKIWNHPYGVHFYLNLKFYPESEAIWRRYYLRACSEKKKILRCAFKKYGCKQQVSNVELKVAKRMFISMCKPRGLTYFKRIYHEEKQCIGNVTATKLYFAMLDKCDAKGYNILRKKLGFKSRDQCRYLSQDNQFFHASSHGVTI
ncbi:hypothetical protein PoB_002118500 [Plakobranchus ocellatus]|uniref:Uncharacterized protein n=1 Tax=Plakobranchus ocellatus TaxID=259542 RepID=A0AAV3ZHS8_9GAST|nr:hypothetical protein PoB_002118500 [Plakobranchus ocellatus]